MTQECRLQQKQGSKSPADWVLMEFVMGNEKWVYTANKKLILKDQMLPSDEIMMLKLSVQNPYFQIKYDDDPLYKRPENDTFKKLAELFPYHKNVQVVDRIDQFGINIYSAKGNPNLAVHTTDFINETSIHTEDIVTQNNIYRAINIVMKMNKEQKKEVLYHFGYNPTDMKHSKIRSMLIDIQNGIVLNRAKYDDKTVNGQTVPRSFLEYFVDRYKTENEDIYLQTMVLKALLIKMSDGTNIIEKRANGYYFIKENSIGQNLIETVAYLKRNPRDMEYVKSNIEKNDTLVEDDIPSLLRAKGINDTEEVVTEETKEELKNNETFQYREKLLGICRQKYRMTVTDELSISELENLQEEGRKTFQKLKFYSEATKQVAKHPEWSYERVVQVKNEAIEQKKAEREDKKKNKYAVA